MSKARKTEKRKTEKPKIPGRLPGDPSKAEMIKRMIRVEMAAFLFGHVLEGGGRWRFCQER